MGVAMNETARSALGVTGVVTLAELFAGFESGVLVVTRTVSRIEGGAAVVGVTTIVSVTVVPAETVPSWVVSVVSVVERVGVVPCDAKADTSVTFTGRTLMSVVPAASFGPL